MVVVGSGGAGLTAAIVAAHRGLRVLLAEKTAHFGGTTALSGGGIWVPCSRLASIAGVADDAEAAAQYVQAVVGPSLRTDLLAAFLDAAPKMVDFLQAHTAAQFVVQRGFADWHPGLPGFRADGRLLSPLEFDGRLLGADFDRLRPPLREFNAPGGMMLGFADLPHIAQVTTAWASCRHIAKLLLRFGRDRLTHERGTRLVMGNALAARLLKSAIDLGVQMLNHTPMQRLVVEQGAVRGVELLHQGQAMTVRARRGVILATGGFSANARMRHQHIPYPDQHVSLVPDGNVGDGLTQAMALGARLDGPNISNAGWVVVSVLKKADGTVIKFPHLFLDRGKPGCIAVNGDGKRFGNESTTNLVEPMHRTGSVPAHLVCDHRFIKKYGLGLVRPGGFGLQRLIKAGYILTAHTLEGLAQRMGANASAFADTVDAFNGHAARGIDPEFDRGANPADFGMGDRNHKPNPCLGPIVNAPFYAVQIFPGDSTTTLGLRVDAHARVLDGDDLPIPGLQAIGLDMNSLWRGRAPGNGANNTLGLTFGYVAACALAELQP